LLLIAGNFTRINATWNLGIHITVVPKTQVHRHNVADLFLRKPRQKPPAKTLSLFDLTKMFPDEQSAIDYLARILWKDGIVCPYCAGKRVSPRKVKNYHRCKDCKKDFTIRVGTIFHRSHIPLHKWLYAMYLIITARKGISSLQLSKELDISQVSAWFLEQRIRAACGNQVTKLLSGIVEMDETAGTIRWIVWIR